MRYRRRLRHAGLRVFLGGTAVCWSACAGDELTEPTTGAVEVTTSTAGGEPDADGYTVLLDGVETRPIGTTAKTKLDDVAPGSHSIGLTGVALNCAVQGDNPRTAMVEAGTTTSETFTVTCAEPPPAAGRLDVSTATSGPSPDPDGYTLTLDGNEGQPIGLDGGVSIEALSPGDHLVGLAGVAANCTVAGENPRTAAVPAGGAVAVGFVIECRATTGGLAVAISGLPGGTDAAVTVTGPDAFNQQLAASATLDGLAPGEYVVSAASVSGSGVTYTPTPEQRTVPVTAGDTAAATVDYTAVPPPSLNLTIAGLYLTQSVQTSDNAVPLIVGRDGFLRVFALANEANTATPSVRVRLYENDALLQTFTIAAPGGSTPTTVDEGTLASSWNVPVPASLIRTGLRVVADIDPSGAVAEGDESDNQFPVSGAPQPVDVRTAPVAAVTLIPVLQSANGLQGRVTAANAQDYFALARRIHPVPSYDATVHAVYTTTGPLQRDDANGAWGVLLSEIDALRIAEGTSRLYYGVVRLDYTGGQVARSSPGLPAAAGYDNVSDRAWLTAHELGHMWGRYHAPATCGTPGGVDPDYPYQFGRIGKYGIDVPSQILKDSTTPDIMGLCRNAWIGDYTYRGVMDSREAAAAAAFASAGVASGAQPSLLVWGRITDGQAVLEPAFQVVTRPVLPRRPGPYSIEGTTSGGGRAFSLSFDASPLADGTRGEKHFAFAVPLPEATAARLESLRLSGPGIAMAARSRSPVSLQAARAPAPVSLSRSAGVTTLRWDATAHPVVMVRDPATGQVLSFGRGGSIVMPAARAEVELLMSDGVRTRSARVRP